MHTVHVDDHDAEERLRKLTLFLTDLRPFWPRLVPLVTGWWRRQFVTEGAFAGGRWQPLSPAYAAWKASRYPGKGILVAAGAMKQAASRPSRSVTPTTLSLTIDDPKLLFHQEGDGVPRRPLVFGDPLPALAAAELDAAAEGYVRDLLNRF